MQATVTSLEAELARPDLWDDPAKASDIARRHGTAKDALGKLARMQQSSDGLLELGDMAAEEGEADVVDECQRDLTALLAEAGRFKLELLLDGEADHLGCYVEVSAGAGGTESCDFAEMLLDMYKGWAERSGHEAKVTERTPGTEAGLRSGVLQIRGKNAYGWTKAESGVHRMVRISEYDTQGRRQTCFAQVGVLPLVEQDDAAAGDIKQSDLRIDTYRSSGPGGQSVNTTDSAVRVTHLPTGVTAASQGERSQHSNLASAMSVLKSRLLEQKLRQREEERSAFKASLGDNTWGNQIRSYVLHPYKLVKDHRTGHETTQAMAVLGGDPQFLTPFMEAALIHSIEDPAQAQAQAQGDDSQESQGKPAKAKGGKKATKKSSS